MISGTPSASWMHWSTFPEKLQTIFGKSFMGAPVWMYSVGFMDALGVDTATHFRNYSRGMIIFDMVMDL